MPSFGEWEYNCERNATVAAYEKAECGGTESCTCIGCRNFSLARNSVFPPEFVSLLESLGIDPAKDSETFHNVRLGPGKHAYGGWFHFVGTLQKTGDYPVVQFGKGFVAWMCKASAPRLRVMGGMSVVQLEFRSEEVPWLLDEPEPE